MLATLACALPLACTSAEPEATADHLSQVIVINDIKLEASQSPAEPEAAASTVLSYDAPTAACFSKDLDHLASKTFPLPANLVDEVRFWIRAYAEWDSDRFILHDGRKLDRVFEVVPAQSYSDPALRRARHQLRARIDRGTWRALRTQKGLRDRFARAIHTSGRYLDEIQATLDASDLPRDLVAMIFIESLFDLDALSPAGALGIWQFMPVTGREYMRVDAVVDERRDPVVATQAAARYLGYAHRKLGSWPLAITSFNYGIGGTSRAVKQARTTDLGRLIARYQHKRFGFAVKNYYAEFQAARHVLQRREACFPGLQPVGRWRYEILELPAEATVAEVAAHASFGAEALRDLNPALTPDTLASRVSLKQGMSLRVPPGTANAIELALAPPPTEAAPASQAEARLHRVREGESVTRIAQRYGVPVRSVLLANDLSWDQTIYPNMVLRVPVE